MRQIGVDGCKAGWIAVSKDQGELTYRIANTACELLSAFPDAERVLIDIPIGLPWRDEPIRSCDRLARSILGDRRSSVFPAPCRAALRAEAIGVARELNRGELGRSPSEQSWGYVGRFGRWTSYFWASRVPELKYEKSIPRSAFGH
jgi:predicted RNase H-like nuclease